MPYVTNQGVHIHYDIEGAGPPLVLQHGYTFNNELWYRFGYVDALKPHYRLILVDARGHGGSEKPHDRAAYTWPVNIADVLAVVDDLSIAQAAFWGYSMGGAIVLGLAQHAPHRVSALIVGGATAYPRSLRTLPDGNNPEAFISWLETMVSARVSPEFRALLLSSDLRALAAAAQDRPSMLDGLPKMRMPCLFYAGEKDGIFANTRSTAMTVPILATRGCPYQCTYCSAPNMWLPRWIPRDPAKVVDEIETYVRKFGAGNFPFQDLTAIIKRDWIKAFCQELIQRKLNIQWQLPTGTRSEAIDPEIAALLRASGMTSMAYAPESGSDYTRQLIKKKMTADKLLASIDAATGAKLNVAVFLVIGFPHDRPEHIAANLPFIDQLAAHGVNDISITFYMALPGTELFHSLYEAGQIKLDRHYFFHILDALALIPSQSYCHAMGRFGLAKWKSIMLCRFYSAKKSNGEAGLLASIRRALRGLFHSEDHATKLETVARNALNSGIETVKAAFGPRYMSRVAEREMFASWDGIYRQIHKQKIASGLVTRAPTDPTELHRKNVITALAKEHAARRTIAAITSS